MQIQFKLHGLTQYNVKSFKASTYDYKQWRVEKA